MIHVWWFSLSWHEAPSVHLDFCVKGTSSDESDCCSWCFDSCLQFTFPFSSFLSFISKGSWWWRKVIKRIWREENMTSFQTRFRHDNKMSLIPNRLIIPFILSHDIICSLQSSNDDDNALSYRFISCTSLSSSLSLSLPIFKSLNVPKLLLKDSSLIRILWFYFKPWKERTYEETSENKEVCFASF